MHENLLNAVKKFKDPTILVVGDFMLDVYIYGDATRISPEAPVPVLRIKESHSRCGGAASVVMDIAALGASAVSLGIIGDDDHGNTMSRLLADQGLDTTGLIPTAQRPTTTKTRLIGLAQHRHQQQLFRMDTEVSDPLSGDLADQVLKVFEQQLERVDTVCLQDYQKGLLTESICQTMIQRARQAGKRVLVDPACGVDYAKYRGATLITPNRQESSLAAGFDLNNTEDYAKAAIHLKNTLDLESVVITLDKDGAYVHDESVSALIPTQPRRVYDVTGAGDMVLATLATALSGACDLVTAVHLANIAGGIEVGKFGVATVSTDEMIDEIAVRYGTRNGKVHTLESLLVRLASHRSRGRTIVFTNGCFDILHRGHVEYLRFCKQQGDIVVLGLNSDASVRSIKGPDRPINPQDDRAVVLSALESVDYITLFNEPDPLNLILQIKPDILIKGRDWQDKGVIGAKEVEASGGRVVFAPLVPGRSSTHTIDRIKQNATNKDAREIPYESAKMD